MTESAHKWLEPIEEQCFEALPETERNKDSNEVLCLSMIVEYQFSILTCGSKLNTFSMSKGHSRPHLQVPSVCRYFVVCDSEVSRTLLAL